MKKVTKEDRLSVFLFGTGETGYTALSSLLNEDVVIVGVCTNHTSKKASLLFQFKAV